jgi:hypothetical protein
LGAQAGRNGRIPRAAPAAPHARLKVLFSVAEGLRHLHALAICRSALTPANVLLDRELGAVVAGHGLGGLRARRRRKARRFLLRRDRLQRFHGRRGAAVPAPAAVPRAAARTTRPRAR